VIEVSNLSRSFGDLLAVDSVSFAVEAGTITALVGTSGSGKSTLLRLINRLIEPTSGAVKIDGRDTSAVSGEALRRGIGYVIQGYGLFPHWTVEQNIATVPQLLGWDKPRIARRVNELLLLLGLAPELYAGKLPRQLSGGQQQRVGVARAIAAEPKVLLMDEPFGALDPIIRIKAQEDILAIQRRVGITILLVTHDLDEAIRLGDRIAVMDSGRLLQYGSPAEILANPAQGFVEKLVGGADRPLRLLSLGKVAELVEPGAASGAPISDSTSLRDALSDLLWRGVEALPVASPSGGLLGRITLPAIVARAGRQT
jgi:osmoprotectant transport system ATP-binding protein